MRKLYIFDLDGLLVDTEKMMNESWYNSFEHFELNISQTKTLELVGLSLMQIKSKVIDWTDTNCFDDIHIYAINDFWKNADNYGIGIKDGVVELLDYLKTKGVLTALATSTVTQRGIRILNQTKLISYFDLMLFGDQVEKTKPNPEIFLAITSNFRIPLHDAIIFEDSYNGIKAGNEAKIDVVFIKDMVDPFKQGQVHIHSSFKSLLEYLEFITKSDDKLQN